MLLKAVHLDPHRIKATVPHRRPDRDEHESGINGKDFAPW